MFFNYSFLSLSLVLIYFSITHSMSIDHLPQEHQVLLLAIRNNNNVAVERILSENPAININITDPDDGIPWTAIICYFSDNDHMLKALIDKGLDTTNLVYLLRSYGFKPKTFKILVKFGALKQVTPEQLPIILSTLFLLPTTETQEAIKYILDNELYTYIIKQNIVTLFAIAGYENKICELNAYNEQTTKEYVDNNRMQAVSNCREVLDALKKSGLDFTLKTHDYKKLLGLLANEGSTDLAQYLILHNGLLSAPNLETTITNARAHSDDPTATKFIDEFIKYLPDQEKVVQQDVIAYLKQQWLAHKNKSVVKLLRRFATTQRLFNSRTTPEIAHKIAQYDSTSFQDTKFAYLPSYEKIQEFIVQKKLESASKHKSPTCALQ